MWGHVTGLADQLD